MNRCVLINKERIDETLISLPTPGKKLLEPLKSFANEHGLPLKILEDNTIINEAEVHTHEGDLWQCLEGEPKFICGGEMVDPLAKKNADGTIDERELKSREIRGGTEVILKPGDWLWIPAGEPHQHFCDGTTRLIIIKIPLK